ncbi:MAG: 1,4-dihydroxy-2-naphthoate octaprenyltransferase [bacterium]
MKKIITCFRAPFFTAIIVPVIFGSVLGYAKTGQMNWLFFILTLIGAIAAHGGANTANDYYDYLSGCDVNNPNRTPFSGGSEAIVRGECSPRYFLLLSGTSFLIALICGVYLVMSIENGLLVLGTLSILGFTFGFFYTAPPFKFAYRGFGELMIALGFGPLPVAGAYFVQTGEITLYPFIMSIPITFFILNIIWINEFPDIDTDRNAGKFTLVVRLGGEKARYIYMLFYLAAYISIIPLVFSLKASPLLFIVWFTLPLAMKAVAVCFANYNSVKSLIPAMGMTILIHLLGGVLLTTAILLA